MSLRYNLHLLGWMQFEQLSQALMKAVFDPRIQSTSGAGDQGRDAMFSGTLRTPTGESLHGYFVFQIKFLSSHIDNDEIIGRFQDETEKLIKLFNISPSPHYYFAITNRSLSPRARDELSQLLRAVSANINIIIYDGSDICDFLDSHPEVRTAFPQLLGIRDVNQMLRTILDRPHLARSEALLTRAAELSQVFVPTRAWRDASRILHKHSFLVLTGPPEVGKTCIAHVLGLSYAADEGAGFFDCRLPEDILGLIDSSQDQVFLVDDAFGSTEFQVDLARRWERDLDNVLRKLSQRHRIIWTTRPAPLAEALRRIQRQGMAERFPDIGKVVVDVADLTVHEKALILYRHAKIARLNSDASRVVATHAPLIVRSDFFTPERVRRFVNGRLESVLLSAKKSDLNVKHELQSAIKQEIAQPTDRMMASFAAISPLHRQLLFSFAAMSLIQCALDELELAHRQAFGAIGREQFIELAEDLASHFLRVTDIGYGTPRKHVAWMHPSWRDVAIEALIRDSSSRRTLLKNGPISIVMLAMSVAGGAQGVRALPFVRDADDLAVVCDRIELESQGDAVSLDLLGDLAGVLFEAMSSQNEKTQDGRVRLAATAIVVLGEIRRRSNRDVVDNSLVQEFIRLSILLPELVPSLNFSATFEELSEQMSEVNMSGKVAPTLIAEVIQFLDNVRQLEPRFLVQGGRYELITEFLRHQAVRASQELKATTIHIGLWPEETAREWDGLADQCGFLGDFDPEQARAWTEIEELARERAEILREHVEEEPEYDRGGDGDPYMSDDAIRSIFSDL